MDVKGIMLSEICQTKTNITGSHLYIESKETKINPLIQSTAWLLPESGDQEEVDKMGGLKILKKKKKPTGKGSQP